MGYESFLKPFPRFIHGPYYHQLNKGGLMNIVKTGRLRPTEARQAWGGALAVRAITMNENRNEGDQGRATIEFYAKDAPRAGTAAWLAEWRLPEGEELEIEVVRVLGLVRPEDL